MSSFPPCLEWLKNILLDICTYHSNGFYSYLCDEENGLQYIGWLIMTVAIGYFESDMVHLHLVVHVQFCFGNRLVNASEWTTNLLQIGAKLLTRQTNFDILCNVHHRIKEIMVTRYILLS